MNRLIYFVILFFVSAITSAQTILDNQSKVDQYQVGADNQYHNHLIISGEDITDLSPLTGKITTVTELEIKYCDNLEDLGGWEVEVISNNSVDRVLIYGNDELVSIEGVYIRKAEDVFIMHNSSLLDINLVIDTARSLNIEWNNSLQSLSGVHDMALSSYGYWIGPDNEDFMNPVYKPSLGIVENRSLPNISDLKNIIAGNNIVISGNELLGDISNLENVHTASNFYLSENESLSSIQGVEGVSCQLLSIRANPNLSNLIGLNEFSFTEFRLSENHGIVHLDGLQGIDVTRLQIINNGGLLDFQGFEGNIIESEMIISGNQSLTTIDGSRYNKVEDLHINQSVINDFSSLAGFGANDIYIENNDNLISIQNLFDTQEIDTVTRFGQTDLFINNNDSLLEVFNFSGTKSARNISINENAQLERIELSEMETSALAIYNNPNLTGLRILSVKDLEIGQNSESLVLDIDSVYSLEPIGTPLLDTIRINKYAWKVDDFGHNRFSGSGTISSYLVQDSPMPILDGPYIKNLNLKGSITELNPGRNIDKVSMRSNDLVALGVLECNSIRIYDNSITSLEGLPHLFTKELEITGYDLVSWSGFRNQNLEYLLIEKTGLREIEFQLSDSVHITNLTIALNPYLESISGINELIQDGDTVNYKVSFNTSLAAIDLGVNSISYEGTLRVNNNSELSVCCSLSGWQGNLDMVSNKGICSFTNQESFVNSCDLPVYIFQEDARDTLVYAGNSNSGITLANNTTDDYYLQVLDDRNEEVILSSNDVSLELVTARGSDQSKTYRLTASQLNHRKEPVNFRLQATSNGFINLNKSFAAEVLPNPILFIDAGEPDFQNFGNFISLSYQAGQPAYRFNRIRLNREDNISVSIDNTLRFNKKYESLKERFQSGAIGFDIDIVAFGEAGLYTRRIINELQIETGKLITINTPHSGAEIISSRQSIDDLANVYLGLLLEGASLTTGIIGAIAEEVAAAIIEKGLDELSKNILENTSGSFLDPESNFIETINVNYPLDDIAKHAITTSYNYDLHPKKDLSVPELIRKEYTMYSYLSAICANAEIQGIAGILNDTYVSKGSSTGGLPVEAVTSIVGDHGNLDDDLLRLEIFDLLDNANRSDEFSKSPYTYVAPSLQFNSQVETCSNLAGFLSGLGTLKSWLDDFKLGKTNKADPGMIQITDIHDDSVFIEINDIDSLVLLTSDLFIISQNVSNQQDDCMIKIDIVEQSEPVLIEVFGFKNDSIVAFDAVFYQNENEAIDSLEFVDSLNVSGYVFDTLNYQIINQFDGSDYGRLGELQVQNISSNSFSGPGSIVFGEEFHGSLLFTYKTDTVVLNFEVLDKEYFMQLPADSLQYPENEDQVILTEVYSNLPRFVLDTLEFDDNLSTFNFSINDDRLVASSTINVDFESFSDSTVLLLTKFRNLNDTLKALLQIKDVNEPATLLTDKYYIPENIENGEMIAQLTAVDPEQDSNYFSLVNNPNGSYQLSSIGQLSILDSTFVDFEFTVRDSLVVRLEDNENVTDHLLLIDIWNINEPPTDILLSNDTISENNVKNQLIGTLSAIDQDFEDFFEYTVSHTAFKVENDQLISDQTFDFESVSEYIINVTVFDQEGLQFEKDFQISIIDVEEYIASAHFEENIIVYPNPTKDQVKIDWQEYYKATILDPNGKVLRDYNSKWIDVSEFPAGHYLLRIVSVSGKSVTLNIIKE